MKRILAVTLLASGALAASAQTRLTFDEALARAVIVNNMIERSRTDVDLATAQRDQLLSAVMPRITLNGDLTRNSMEQRFGEGDQAIAILPRNDWAYRITLDQPIYAGRRELRAYSQAKLNVENARVGVRGTEDAALLRVASSYLAVVNADRRVDVEKRNIELAERRLTQAQAFFEAGEVTKVDVLRAETAMKAAQRLLAVAAQQREHAVAQLRTDLDLDGSIEVSAPARNLPTLPDEATLVASAEASRAEVDFAENNVRIAELEVAKQRGFWLPTVRFDGGFIQQRTPFPANQYAYGALRFTVPIFQSGEVTARVAGAKSQEKRAGIALEEAKIGAREDVRRALADLRSAEIGLQLANEQLQAAQAEYDQAFELYRAQEATSLDVASSETSLADARRAVAEETLNRDLAELRVWFAAGQIKAALGAAAALSAVEGPNGVMNE
ncbi:MAG TPA: TolC family protein [Thermoanaerobaculia bacterium]|nr:TolC family protein [Thermoanaerobaculia bacterium]